MKLKRTIFVFYSLCIIYFIVISFWEQFNEIHAIKLIKWMTLISDISKYRISDVKLNSFASNEWLMNGNVLQYSAISTFNSNQDIELESIVLFNSQPSSSNTRCIVILDQSYVINKTIDDLFKMETTHHSIYKASCTISKDLVNATSDVLVAIVDSRDHLALESIFFHTPIQRPRPVKKKQSLINCIQTLRDISPTAADQLKSYIQINKAMGLDKLRFCVIDYKNELILNLTRTYSDYIDFVPIDLNVERVCTRLGLEVNTCKNKWSDHFDLRLLGLFEKLCSNECFMRYRYEYQYISNYDVDELIFPRFHDTNYLERVNSSNMNKQQNQSACIQPYNQYLGELQAYNFTYNVKDFMNKLINKFGPKVACFSFENYLVLNRFQDFFNTIKKTYQDGASTIAYNSSHGVLLFELVVGRNHYYHNKLVELIDLDKCLNETYLSKSSILTNLWKNGAVNLINNRLGKSISNTDNTLSLNQHSCSRIKLGTRRITVPAEIGYVSHFRTSDISSDNILKLPIKSFKIDIEYLYFLVSLSGLV